MHRVLWVVLGAAVLLLFLIWDNDRPWRHWQVENGQRQSEVLARRLQAEGEALDESLTTLAAEVERQRQRWREHAGEVDELEEQRRAFERKKALAEQRAAASRRAFDRATTDAAGDVDGLRQAMLMDRREVEGFDRLIADRRSQLRSLRKDLDLAEAVLAEARRPLEDLQAEIDALPGSFLSNLGPLIALDRSFEVLEVHPLAVDVAASGVMGPAVDRCLTCHLGALEEGRGADWPAVLRSHPRLDLFLDAPSPHPYTTFGCTVCHGGDGRSTDFKRADHGPDGDDPHLTMLPAELLNVACKGCHGDSAAARSGLIQGVSEGRAFYRLGCVNCHAGEAPVKPAPSLEGLAGKVRRPWLNTWLVEPAGGHPRLASAAASDPRQLAIEAHAVTAFLWGSSPETPWPTPPSASPEAGQRLFDSLGCRACHAMEPAVLSVAAPPAAAPIGPSLSGSSGKLRSGWLFAWLQDPKAIDPKTTMPNLRLSSNESASLTAFLMAGDGQVPDGDLAEETRPPVDASLRDHLLFDLLSQELSLQGTQARLDALDSAGRDRLLGQRLVETRGCGGCHALPSGVAAPSGGIPLRDLAVDSQQRLAASHVPELARSLSAMIGVDSPAPAPSRPAENRGGRFSGPVYALDPAMAEALLGEILQPPVPPASALRLTPSPDVLRGEALVTRWGCRGCHQIAGWGGGSFGLAAGSGGSASAQGPPSLDGLGARVRVDWLDAYLRDPSRDVMRSWLEVRMPSYDLTPGERADLIAYFLALDDASPVHTTPATADGRDLIVGSMVFDILQCDLCHVGTEDLGGLEVQELAPDYHLASRRLRPEWAVDWLIDPKGFRPQTTMPTYLAEDGPKGLSYLRGTFDSPMFALQHQRLLRAFDSADEMENYLADRRRVATALRDYVWSLGEAPNLR